MVGKKGEGDMYELWFRKPNAPHIMDRTLVAAIRPGDRRLPNLKGTAVGDAVRIRVLDKPGDDEAGLEPVLNGVNESAIITGLDVKRLGDLTAEDLADCVPFYATWQQMAHEMGLIYNQVFTGDDTVTVVRFRYQEAT